MAINEDIIINNIMDKNCLFYLWFIKKSNKSGGKGRS